MKRSRGTREQPLIVYITTAGSVLDGPLVNFIEQGQDTLSNYEDNINERTFYYLAQLDNPNEANDPRLWIKANPNFGLMQIADMINDYKTDRKSPRELADWVTKQFNIFAETDEMSFITPETLKLNERVIDLDTLDFKDCVGGYDLSDTEDFTSACLEFPLEDGSIFVLENRGFHRPVMIEIRILNVYGNGRRMAKLRLFQEIMLIILMYLTGLKLCQINITF